LVLLVLPVKLDFVDQLVNKESKEVQELKDPLDQREPQDQQVLMVREV